jgi:ribosomal protein S6
MLIPVTVGVVQAERVQEEETQIQIHRAETERIHKEEIQIHNETKIQIRNLRQRIPKQKNGIRHKDSVNVPKRQRQNLQNSMRNGPSTSQRLTQKVIRTDRKNVNGKSTVEHKNFYQNNSRS